jgi:hypothetical protein
MITGRQRLAWLFFIIALTLLGAVATNKYLVFGRGDENALLLVPKHWLDSDFLKNDWHIPLQAAEPTRRGYGVVLLPFLALFGDTAGVLIAYLLNLFFFNLSVFLLSRHIWRDTAAALSTALFAVASAGMQSSSLATILAVSGLSGTSIAVTLGIFSFLALLQRRHLLVGILLGAATFVHVGMGVGTAALVFTYLLLSRPLREWWRAAVAFLALGSINIVPSLLVAGQTIYGSAEYLRIFKVFYASGIVPSVWPLWNWLAGLSIIFLLVRNLPRIAAPDDFRRFAIIGSLTVAALWVVQFVVTDILPIKSIALLHFYRLSMYWYLFAFLYAGRYIAGLERQGKGMLGAPLIFLAYLAGVRPAFLYAFIAFELLLELLPQLVRHVRPALDRLPDRLSALASALSLITGLLFSLRPLLAASHYASVLGLSFLSTRTRYRALLLLLLLPAPLIYAGVIHSEARQMQAEKFAAYEFIRASTPRDAVFLVNPTLEDFRFRAGRAVVLDSKNFPYVDATTKEYLERLQDIAPANYSVHEDIFGVVAREYERMNAARLQNLSDKYRFDYALFKAPRRFPHQVVYENSEYVLYKMR